MKSYQTVESFGFPIPKARERRFVVTASEYHLGATGLSLIDLVAAFSVFLLACWLSPSFHALDSAVSGADPRFSPLGIGIIYAFLLPLVAHVFGLHNPLSRRQITVLVVKYAAATALALALLTLMALFVFYARIGRHILVFAFLLSVAGLTSLRMGLWRLSEERKKRLLLVGAGQIGNRVASLLSESQIPYEVVAFADTDPSLIGTKLHGRPVLDGRVPVEQHCREHEIHEIVTCIGQWKSRRVAEEISTCMLSGVQVSNYPTFIEKTFYKVPVEFIEPLWFFQINTSGDYAIYRGLKRAADILAALAGLVMTSPLLLLAALVIKLESPGRVFYSQVRVGQYNRPFRIWKLRSMRNDAEKNGAQWASKGDSRVTRVGWLLRKTRVDELPQFWNVLRGEMSLIGPRPERPEFVEELAQEIPFYEQRHLLKPGITGWAQINYPYGASKEDALNKLKYDLYYIKNASLLLDIHIVLRTAGAVMQGAR